MKNLIIVLVFLIAPFFLLGQGQRLGLLPTSLNLNNVNSTGSVKAFCSDGRTRSIPSSTNGKYNWIQNTKAVEVVIDGKVYPDGIGKLIQEGEVIIKTRGDEEVIFELNPNSKIKSITINIKESNIISDRPDDYIIEPLWLNCLRKIKVVNNDVSTFEQIKPKIILFQKNAKIENHSGYLDEETRVLLEIYSKYADYLIENGILDKNFKDPEQVINAYNQFSSEWEHFFKNKDNIIYRDDNNIDVFKGMIKNMGANNIYEIPPYPEGYYLVNNNGKIEKWKFTYDIEGKWEKPISKDVIKESDIIQIENELFDNLATINEDSKKEGIYYCVIGNVNLNSKTIRLSFNGEVFDQKFTENPFDEIVNHITMKIEKLPKNSTVIIVRDRLQFSCENYDKMDIKSNSGDKFLNIQLLDEVKLINFTEATRNIKKQIRSDQRIFISKFDNIESDFSKLKNIPIVKSSQDIITYMSPKSFGIYADQASAMKSKLIRGKVKVIDIEKDIINEKEIKQSNVLILSGHKNENFELYLKKLAEKGLLQNKVVAIFSCYEQGTTHLNSYLIQVGGARQIIFFPTKIDVNATKAVFSELVDMLNSEIPSGGITLEKAINLSIDRAIIKYPDLKNELEEIRSHIPQIAFHSTFNTKNNKNG